MGIGGGRRSISGDHRNLKAYGVPTRAKAPIVALLTPALANHADSVENVNSSGSPLANPSGRISNTRRSLYSATERRHPVMPFASAVTSVVSSIAMSSYHLELLYSCITETNIVLQLH